MAKQVPLYASYDGKLTQKECVENRNRLLEQMDAMAIAAETITKQEVYDGLRERFLALKQQKKLYERHSWIIFSRHSDRSKAMERDDAKSNHLSPPKLLIPDHSQDRSGSQPRVPTPVLTENIPPLPAELQQNHTVNHHHPFDANQRRSDEAARKPLKSKHNSPHNHQTTNPVHPSPAEVYRPHYASSPPQAQGDGVRLRVSPPNTHSKSHTDSRPYIIGDESTPDPNERIASLLFTKWPYPIAVQSLYQQFQEHYQMPLEVSDEVIASNPFIEKHSNPFAGKYSEHSESKEFWKLKDAMAFITSFNADKQYELIRHKMHLTMQTLHPDGIKKSELPRIFKYSIGVDPKKLDSTLSQQIDRLMFDEVPAVNGDSKSSSSVRLVMKGMTKPRFPVASPWKSFALSLKQQLICVLSMSEASAPFTKQQLMDEYLRLFGVPMPLESWYIQMNLEKLIDPQRFDRDRVFVLSPMSRQKNKDWISWWHENGPSSIRNVPVIRNAEPHDRELPQNNGHYQLPPRPVHHQSPHGQHAPRTPHHDHSYPAHHRAAPVPAHGAYREHDHHGTEEQKVKQSYNEVVRYGQPRDETRPRYEPRYEDRNDRELRAQRNGWSHDPDCLVFIGGIPLSVDDPTPILQMIERDFNVKFNNYRPPRLRRGQKWGYIAPIPVETAKMAQTLIATQTLRINIESLGIGGYREAEIRVREYRPREAGMQRERTPYQGAYRGQSGGNGYRPTYPSGGYGSRANGNGNGCGYGVENQDQNGHRRVSNYAEFKAQNDVARAQAEQDEFGRDNSW